MHRQSASRTGEQEDQQRGAQAQPQVNATASQQSVLNLQQGVGNSLTGQIVQRTPQVIRRAGDKLSFDKVQGLQDLDAELAARVEKVVEDERTFKRGVKDKLEDGKETEIGGRHDESEKRKEEIRSREEVPKELLDVLVSIEEAETITAHKDTLARYHDLVQQDSGWRWDRLKDRLREIEGIVVGDHPKDGKVEVTSEMSKAKVYTIYFDKERFNPEADDKEARANVFTKRGYANDGSMPAKEFVDDDNQVKTRRIVTRAVTIWHLASMFGIKFVDTDFKSGATKVEPHYLDDLKQERIDAQMPRYTGTAFGGHADTFDLQEAAGYNPPGSQQLSPSEFTKNYEPRDPGLGRDLKKLDEAERTKFEFTTGRKEGRNAAHDMGINEKASMQVRNGSGDNQPFLSTASVQVDPTSVRPQKVIRANKGERFDTGAENQATVKVDLAEAKKAGVKIVNQHDDESNQHKIAWDRFYDQKDVEELGRRFALADQYATTKFADIAEKIRPQDKELKLFDQEDQDRVRANNVKAVIAKKYTKRVAPKELDEYIYSARKNREVLMDKIPLSCVTAICLNGEDKKWPGMSLETKKWYDFKEVQGTLRSYLLGTETDNVEDEKYDRIQEMFRIAIEQKKLEGGTRV
jgi:hypothetical protein